MDTGGVEGWTERDGSDADTVLLYVLKKLVNNKNGDT